MIGKVDDRRLKTKGAETYGFVLFLLYMVQKYRPYFTEADAVLEAGGKLVRIVEIISTNGVNLDIATRQDFYAV